MEENNSVVVFNSIKYGDIIFTDVEVNALGEKNILRAIKYMDKVYNKIVSDPKKFIDAYIAGNWYKNVPEDEDSSNYYNIPSVDETAKKLAESKEQKDRVKKQQNTPCYKEEQEKLFDLRHNIENKKRRAKRPKPQRLPDDELFLGRAEFVKNYLKKEYGTTGWD